MSVKPVVIIGAGIAGLTAAALLAHEGIPVTLVEAHHQAGGCAGTFCRGPYVFDVGATQVAGLGPGGIHDRLFRHLDIVSPSAEILDPCCLVDLLDGYPPINLWHDPKRWKEERQRHFPGTEKFWSLCHLLHKSNWAFVQRDPVLPMRNLWDFRQFLNALGPFNLASGLVSMLSVEDLLRMTAAQHDHRLKKFLDLQLKLYSQEPADRTAALYGATVLQMAHAPLGLWHLDGSMQKLSDVLTSYLKAMGVHMLFKHKVISLKKNNHSFDKWRVQIIDSKGKFMTLNSCDVVCTLPPQSLFDLLPLNLYGSTEYQKKLAELPQPSGAVVFYGALNREDLPSDCPGHIQLAVEDPGPLFVSISKDGDGRAPRGQATLIASLFSQTSLWCNLDNSEYQMQKRIMLEKILLELENWFGLKPNNWLHKELATPRSFAKWTGRPNGIVGGLGQHPRIFGPFGLSSRTPLSGLWLCGDSIYPGEGTAGVSQSALMACKQLMNERGLAINILS